jgi:hypothetical protein
MTPINKKVAELKSNVVKTNVVGDLKIWEYFRTRFAEARQLAGLLLGVDIISPRSRRIKNLSHVEEAGTRLFLVLWQVSRRWEGCEEDCNVDKSGLLRESEPAPQNPARPAPARGKRVSSATHAH